jgi:putative phage-type endonuclease
MQLIRAPGRWCGAGRTPAYQIKRWRGEKMIKLEAATDRERWLMDRRSRMGATDVSAILGINPYRTAYEVWLDKRGLLTNWEGNDATRLGQLLEPVILDEAERLWAGDDGMERNVVVKHDKLLIAATLDGWLNGPEEVVEIKTAGLTNEFADLSHWGEAGTDQIPHWYLVQVQTQLLCTEAEWARMLALISGRGLVAYNIRRDPEIGKIISETCARWWNDYVESDSEPSREPVPSIEILKRIKREPNSVVYLGYEDLELVEDWQIAKSEASAADKRAKELQAKVLQRLLTAEGALLPDGRMMTYLETHRKGYVVEPTTYRTLRIEKAGK